MVGTDEVKSVGVSSVIQNEAATWMQNSMLIVPCEVNTIGILSMPMWFCQLYLKFICDCNVCEDCKLLLD